MPVATAKPAPDLTPEAIRALRARFGMSQEELAAMIGCAQETLSRWETGQRRPVGLYAVAVRRLLAIAPAITVPKPDAGR